MYECVSTTLYIDAREYVCIRSQCSEQNISTIAWRILTQTNREFFVQVSNMGEIKK